VLEAGIDYVVVNLTGDDDAETLELLANQVVPKVQAMTARNT